MSAIEVGQIWRRDQEKFRITAVGEENVLFVHLSIDTEEKRSIEYVEKYWTRVTPFFRIGKKYMRQGSASTYTVQSLYQNGDIRFAVLFWSNPITGKVGVVGATDGDLSSYEEVE